MAKLFKRPGIFGLISTILLFSAGLSIELHFSMTKGRDQLMRSFLIGAILTLTGMMLIMALYTRGYLRLRRYVADNQVHANRREESPEYLNKLFKTVLILLIAMIISSSPVLFTTSYLAIAHFTNSSFPPPGSAFLYDNTPFLIYTNGVTNAVIIFYRNKKSWDWFMRNIRKCCCCCKQGSQEEQQNSAAAVFNNREPGV